MTVLNLIVLVVSMVFFINARASLREMNEAKAEPCALINNVVTVDGRDYTIVFGSKAVRVVDSYRADSRFERLRVIAVIMSELQERGIETMRTASSFEGEWLLHNIAYEYGERDKSTDVDLDYAGDCRWYITAAGELLGNAGL